MLELRLCPSCDSDVVPGADGVCPACRKNSFFSDGSPRPDVSPVTKAPDRKALTTVDWIIVVVFSGLGFLIGIFRLLVGKPSGGAMLGYSALFMLIWAAVSVLITLAAQV